jgi:hypothetical protein
MAKTPADRPWDAEAVEFALTELRARANKAEPVPMARPVPSADDAGVAVGTSRAATPGAKKARKAARTLGTFAFGGTHSGRRVLETAALVAALIAVSGAIGWVVWPPGQDYLYRHAKTLMASSSRGDWITARDEYIEPLNRRFPNHPYKHETQAWLDTILLHDAEGRAARLESPVRTALTEPNTPVEHQYVATAHRAATLAETKDDLGLIRVWQDFARQLHPDDRDERGWYLLAEKRLLDTGRALEARKQFVRAEIERAQAKFNAGYFEDASEIEKRLREDYGAYTSLDDVLPEKLKPAKPK